MMTRQLIARRQVAEILGVSPRRVSALAERRADFPKPAAATLDGRMRLWRAQDIERWAQTADRSPGRPRKPQVL